MALQRGSKDTEVNNTCASINRHHNLPLLQSSFPHNSFLSTSVNRPFALTVCNHLQGSFCGYAPGRTTNSNSQISF
jgi:hypothetical protein